jgi:Tol biopolymer transport system component
MDVDGQSVREIYRHPTARFLGSASWSRDGEQIAFHANIEDGRILIVSAKGGIARDLGMGARPDWSPDGKQLLFSIQSATGQSVALIELPNGSPRVVASRDNGHQTDPTWSPDEKSILYATHQ